MSIVQKIYCSGYFMLGEITMLGTIIVSLINYLFKNKRWYRYICAAGICLFAGAILFITLLSRSNTGQHFTVNLIPFSSLKLAFQGYEEGFRVCFMNSLLFYPLGCLFFGYNNKRKRSGYYFGFGLLLSLIIEVLQFALQLGVAEIDDIIFNVLGVILGYFFCYFVDDVLEAIKSTLKML